MVNNVVAQIELLDFTNSLSKGKVSLLDGDISSSDPVSAPGNEEASFSSLLQEDIAHLNVEGKNDTGNADSPPLATLPESAAAERAVSIDKRPDETRMPDREDEKDAAGPSEEETELHALLSGELIVPAGASLVNTGKIASGDAGVEEPVTEPKQTLTIVSNETEGGESLHTDKNEGFTAAVLPPPTAPKGGLILPVEESAGKAADNSVSSVDSPAIGSGAAGNSPESAAGISNETDALSGIAGKDGSVNGKLPGSPGSFGRSGDGSDLHAAISAVEELSGKIKGEVVQKDLSGYSEAEMAFNIDRGNLSPKGSEQPASASVPGGKEAPGAVLPQANLLKDPGAQQDSEAHLLQLKTASPAENESGVGKEAPLPSTNAQQGRLNLSGEESAKAAHSSNVDISAYNAGRPSFTVNESVPVEGRNLVEQVLSQLPEDALKGSNRVRLSLYPESLGKVDMDIVVRENRVQVFIMAERADVVQALHGQQEQLKNALQAQGLQVNNLDFQLRENPAPMDDGSRGGDLWRQGNQGQGEKEGENDKTPVMTGSWGVLTANMLQIQTQTSSISLFV